MNVVAPPQPLRTASFHELKALGANAVALSPYAFVPENEASIKNNYQYQWWGESPKGIQVSIDSAHQNNLMVMLKPHLWVAGDGWAGELSFKTDEEWKQWEKAYTQYILKFAEIAESKGVSILCIGTEIRQSVKLRPTYWKELILETRKKYSGLLTYAANWDNYENISFWKELDLIGIDAYFPIHHEKTWDSLSKRLKDFSEKENMPLIFTEFGYPPSQNSLLKPYLEARRNGTDFDEVQQMKGYELLFNSIWNKDFFLGGFIWKWFPGQFSEDNTRYSHSPQGKLAEGLIREVYKMKKPGD